MTNIRKKKNYDSIPSQLLAYELAGEAQNIMYVMAAIAAITPRERPMSPEKPSCRWAMEPVRQAIIQDAIAAAAAESSPREW